MPSMKTAETTVTTAAGMRIHAMYNSLTKEYRMTEVMTGNSAAPAANHTI